MITPPATCDSQPNLLTTRPQSCTATTCVTRTTPVSVSTDTSATCTPPTPLLERLRVSLAWVWLGLQFPEPLTCSLPRMAQTFFHGQDLSLALSRTMPGMISSSSSLAPSFFATLLN